MAIENLELSKQDEQNKNVPVLFSTDTVLKANQILTASMQKIRHPLIDSEMVLYGFIGEVSNNVIFEEFEVDALKIRFKERESDSFEHYKIYPKILIDLKENRFYDLFPQLENIKYSYMGHCGGRKAWRENDPGNKRNFYFFKNNFDTTPDVFSDELYLVCKYREDGKFKYGLFSPHEVIFGG